MENNIQNNEEQGTVMNQDGAPKRDYFLPVSILVAAVLVAGAVVFAQVYKPAPAAVPAPTGGTGQQQAAADPASVLKTLPGDSFTGDANAPVTVTEYGDYQCPFCGQFFSKVEPLIMSKYAKTGKVKFVFRNFSFLGPESTAAAQAADCAADQNQQFAYHGALYNAKLADESAGGTENDGSFNRTLFLKLAANLKLDIPTFTSCIDSNKYASRVADEVTAAGAAGVNSTPSVFVNGKQVLDSTGHSVGANSVPIMAAIAAAVGN